MQFVVFEDAGYRNLLPLVYARGTFDLRCGFDSLLDKIETAMGRPAGALFVRQALAAVVKESRRRPVNQTPTADDQMWINGRLLLRRPIELPPGAAIWDGDTLLAARLDARAASAITSDLLLDPARLLAALGDLQTASLPEGRATLIRYPWHLIQENEAEIVRQFADLSPDLLGEIHPRACLVNEAAIHVGDGSRIKPGVVLDADKGPIHIDEDVFIGPNALITGPCSIGRGCVIRPGAAIGGCGIGPVCKLGGEIEDAIFQGFSNKQHDGFLGHAYVGEWVNLGADTVNSDLKNTYGPVAVPINGRPVDSGLTFVGAFIGDHAKTGIGAVLPTGCVIGFAANVFLSRHVPRFVPSFSWLTDSGRETNDPARALAVAKKVVARRAQTLSAAAEARFLSIAKESQQEEQPPPAAT